MTKILLDELTQKGKVNKKTKKWLFTSALIAGLTFIWVSMFSTISVAASIQAVTFTGGTQNTIFPGPWLLGWQFQVTKEIQVTDLGIFDVNGGGILDTDGGAREIGLYEFDGASSSLIGRATVAVGTPGESAGSYNAHYTSIPAITLTPGSDYIIVAQESLYDPDNIYDANIMTAPEIEFITGKATAWTGSLPQDVTFEITRSNSYFGGTFKFPNGHPVPVPATIFLFGSGIAGLFGSRFRRKKK